MNKKTKLIVSSDSWAWCWYPSSDEQPVFASKRHLDLCKGVVWRNAFPIMDVLYRAHGYDVTVIAAPGGNNFEQIHGIARCEDPADAILFMQTDPLRDISIRGLPEHMHENPLYGEDEGAVFLGVPQWSVDYFQQQVDNMLREIYTELCKTVSEKHPGCKLMVVGGNSAVDTSMLTQIAEQYGCDLHILSYCLLDELETLCKVDPVVHQHYLESNTMDKRPVHPCFLMRLAIDETWNKELLLYLQQITLAEWYHNFQQYLGDYPKNHTHKLSQKYKQASMGKIQDLCWPDHCHLNAGSHVWLAEQVNQYLESRGL